MRLQQDWLLVRRGTCKLDGERARIYYTVHSFEAAPTMNSTLLYLGTGTMHSTMNSSHVAGLAVSVTLVSR